MDSPPARNLGKSASKVADAVREGIADGTYRSGVYLPSVRALKESLSVNYNTVRRALKALEAEGILLSEPRHGYRVLGRAHDPDCGCPLAFVSWRDRGGDDWDPLHQHLMSGLEHAAGERGWTVLSVGSRRATHAEVVEQLKASRVWGAVLESSDPEFLAMIRRAGIPAVSVDAWREDQSTDVVLQDNYRGGYLAGRELITRGCKRITWLGNVEHLAHHRERFGGAAAALAEAGLTLQPDRCFGPESKKGRGTAGQWDTWREVARGVLSSSDRPDALLALWGRVSQATKMAADDLGLVVGRDFQMVGWTTEEEYESVFLPAFSPGPVPPAVVWRVRDMAAIALKRLAERRTDPDTPRLRTNVPVTLRKES